MNTYHQILFHSLELQLVDYFFPCAILYKSLFPHKNVRQPMPIRYLTVWNMFSCNQKNPKRPKMAASPRWKPRALGVKGKLDTLMRSLAHKMRRRRRGRQMRTLNKLETNFAGLLSGSRNKCWKKKKKYLFDFMNDVTIGLCHSRDRNDSQVLAVRCSCICRVLPLKRGL